MDVFSLPLGSETELNHSELVNRIVIVLRGYFLFKKVLSITRFGVGLGEKYSFVLLLSEDIPCLDRFPERGELRLRST